MGCGLWGWEQPNNNKANPLLILVTHWRFITFDSVLCSVVFSLDDSRYCTIVYVLI